MELGYDFLPYPDRRAVGYAGLSLCLAERPSGRHFDPEHLRLPLIDSGDIESTEIYHPWPGATVLRVAAGRFFLLDRYAEEVIGFSFGGRLRLIPGADCTHCELHSDAPIFEVLSDTDPESLLVAELESLLARSRASWRGEDRGFEARLATLSALDLCAGLLRSLDLRIRGGLRQQDPRHFEPLHHLVQRALTQIHAASDAPLIEVLLAPTAR